MLGLDENSQKKIIDTIVGQKLSVRDTENLIKNVKESNKSVKTVSKTKLNIELLDKIIQDLKSKNIKSSLQNNSIKINFNSQEDIEIISKYFIK